MQAIVYTVYVSYVCCGHLNSCIAFLGGRGGAAKKVWELLFNTVKKLDENKSVRHLVVTSYYRLYCRYQHFECIID